MRAAPRRKYGEDKEKEKIKEEEKEKKKEKNNFQVIVAEER